ncbi:MAG TPA: glycosyltransferase family 4 protein [Candidatus Limnocylindrales bacterium]|nr:glycosyltransferase family 4 protein [Candidatus Limnocylindrales bacterium]
MKIGLVTPYVYPLPGGVNQHVRHLYEQLRVLGHDVRILSASHGLQRASEGDVIRIGKGYSMPANGSVGTITVSPRYVSQVRDVLEREQFDLLHFHEPFVPFLSLVVLRQSTSVNIATFHAYGGFSPAYEFGSKVMAGYAERLHGRIAVSAAARHFIDRFFPGDYKVIPNGVDTGRFARAVPIARWQDGTKNILFVGRFESRKGLLDLLKAYRILRKAGAPCRLLVVGGGPQEREARRYVMARRLGGVEFLGRVSDPERDSLFKTADVYCSPATGRESFGIVLLEAMAAGTAIVCSDIHGYKGVVRRGREALLVPPREPKALAEALGRVIADDRLREAMGASGIERAQEFSWERVTAKVEDYYGFVIRRLAAQGQLPSGYRPVIHQEREVLQFPRSPLRESAHRRDV